MRHIRIILFVLPFIFISGKVNSQMHYDTLITFDDVQIFSGAGTTNYKFGLTTNISVNSSSQFYRFLSNYNLTSLGIPSNAVITTAELILTPGGSGEGTVNSSDLYVEAITSSWAESTVTYNTRPSTTTTNQVTTSSLVSGKRKFNLTTLVQNIVNGSITYFGFQVRRNPETTLTTTTQYATEDASVSTNRPRLKIHWYVPLNIASTSITHCNTIGGSEGAITPTITGGSGSLTYQWYNSSGLMSGFTSSSISGRPYGWYGLKITGSLGDVYYKSFIIGVKCQEVTITYNPGPDFIDDAWISTLVPTVNKGTTTDFYDSKQQKSLTWNTYKGLIKFNLWVDPNLSVTQANLQLYGKSHDYTNANASYLKKITSTWKENEVTWNTSPTTTTTNQVSLATSTSTTQNYLTNNIISFWNDWRGNDATNYGMMLELQSSADVTAKMWFHSSDTSLTTIRPSISFKFVYNATVAPGTATPGSSALCSGSTTTITLTGQTSGTTLQWEKGTDGVNFSIISGATSASYTTLSSTTVDTYYRCKVTWGACTAVYSNSVPITIKPVPTVTVNAATLCTVPDVTLTATPSIGGGTYLWSNSATTASIVVAPSTTTTYTVVYTLNGCASPQGSGRVDVCSSSFQFTDSTEVGQISVSINEAPSKVAPYSYQISQFPNPNMSTIYHLFKDSIYGGTLDSASFFLGSTTEPNFTFYNLKMGRHYVSVFDSRGIRIFDREILVLPSFTLSNQTNLTISGNTLSSTGTNASAAVDVYMSTATEGVLGFQITDKSKTQFLGIIYSTSTTPGTLSSYRHGFSIKSNSLYLIENGTEGTTSYTIQNNSEFKLRQTDSLIEYFSDGVLLKSSVLDGTQAYKSAFSTLQSNVTVKLLPLALTKKKFYNYLKPPKQFDCDVQIGGFNFKAKNVMGLSLPYTWIVLKDNVQVGASGPTSSTVFDFDPTPYGIGKYEIRTYTTYSGTTYACTTIVNLGIETIWSSMSKYDNNPNSYSVVRNTVSPNTWSYARAENVLEYDEDGWVNFRPIYSTNSISASTLRLSSFNTNNLEPVYTEDAYVSILKSGNNYYLIWSGPTPGMQPINFNTDIKLKINTTTNDVKLYANEIFINSFDRPTGKILLRAHSVKYGDGLKDVVSSFNCSNYNQYFILKDEVEESVAYVAGAKLKFKYEEDYFDNSGVLTYSIKCLNDDVSPSLVTVNKPLNTNWIEIPIGVGGIALISGKVYLLEVKDAKGRKQYLKFKKS